MASIYKRDGAKKYSIKYKDETGHWRVAPGYTDKSLTQKKANLLEHDVQCRMRGVVDPFEGPKKEALTEHVTAYRRYLESKDRCEDHTERSEARINAIIDGCNFARIEDLCAYNAADKVGTFLKLRREADEDPISAATSNHYLTAFKGFVRWAAKNKRIPASPIAMIDKTTTENDTPRNRRAATADQFAKIIKAARNGGECYNLTGEQRAWLYMVAAYTGLRASELASLRPIDFKLAAKIPHILVRASVTKNGEEVEQPIREDLARMLAGWIPDNYQRDERLWRGRWHKKAARMLQIDLKAAGIAYETDEGTLDFHALRVTYITELARAGTHPKIAQTLARHSVITLTMGVYTKLGADENAAALAGLPALPMSAPRAHQTSVRKRQNVSAPDRSTESKKTKKAAKIATF